MKIFTRLATLLSCIIIVLGAFSCSEDDARLGASTTTCAFKAEGGEKIIYIETTEGSWSASLSAADHFTIKQEEGRLVITSPENSSKVSKTASVKVTSGNASLLINVAQSYRTDDGQSGSITLNPTSTSYEFYSDGGTFRVAVSSPLSWSAASDEEWCKIVYNETAGTLAVTAASNKNDEPLSATVTITAGALIKKIIFTQSIAADNPYTALLGWWDLYCPQWTQNGIIVPDNDGESSTHASCLFTEDVFNESIIINHLFLENSLRGAYYSKEDRRISIPLGWLVHYINPYSYYLALLTVATPYSYLPGTATGIISEDGQTITIAGVGGGWTIGVFSISQNETNYRISGMYYPNSHELTLVKRVASPK